MLRCELVVTAIVALPAFNAAAENPANPSSKDASSEEN